MDSDATKIVWRDYAPGRAEFLGNHTDYNDGLVLGIGLDVGTTVEATERGDAMLSLRADDLAATARAARIA
jgi:galactokinase